MASLADELDLDPAFHDADEGQRHSEGLSLQDDAAAYNDVNASSADSSPVQRRRIYGRRRRSSSVDEHDDSGTGHGASRDVSRQFDDSRHFVGPSDSFGSAGRGNVGSLADEIDVGAADMVHAQGGGSLADEFGNADVPSHSARLPNLELNEEERTLRDREHHLYVSEKLNDCIRQTDAFLEKLRSVNGVDSAASLALRGPQIANAHVHSAGFAALQDDTARIEDILASYSKHIREQTSARESQIRELQECNRALRRAFDEGGELVSAIVEVTEQSDVDALSNGPASAHERNPLGFSLAHPNAHARETIDDSADFGVNSFSTMQDGMAASKSQQFGQNESSLPPSDSSNDLSAFADILGLQQSTVDLVHSLGGIHEFSQIAQASIGSAARKVRNTRTVLSNWQAEVAGVDESLAWIAAYEEAGRLGDTAAARVTAPPRSSANNTPQERALSSARDRGFAAAASRPQDIRAWTQGQVDKFNRTLEDAHARARELLQPVQDPILDQIASGKA